MDSALADRRASPGLVRPLSHPRLHMIVSDSESIFLGHTLHFSLHEFSR